MQELITKKVFRMGIDDLSEARIGDTIIMAYPPKFNLPLDAEYRVLHETPELLENKNG